MGQISILEEEIGALKMLVFKRWESRWVENAKKLISLYFCNMIFV